MNTNSVSFFKTEPVVPIPVGHQLVLAAWEIVNPENMGQIIRLAHNVGAKKVLFITQKENRNITKIKKTAGFSYEQMDWALISESEFFSLFNEEHELVVLETCEASKNIFGQKLPAKTILLAGNESHGLPVKVIEQSNFKVHIPMPGGCKSMNISHAMSVAAFEWYRQNARKH
jgi:tRNA (cytidine/uridine-2'-O-)-methyltransferase